MNDSELSLEVARIICPDEDWKIHSSNNGCCVRGNEFYDDEYFNYTTDDALGKMCKWLAKSGLITGPVLYLSLLEDNPHKAIAEAIVETSD